MVGRCLFIAIVVFVTGGCGGDADDGFPTGQWLTTRPDGEVWIADFKADGLWTFAYRGKAEIQHSGLFTEHTAGKYSASDDTLTIEADYHCAAFEHTQRARYSWTLRNRRLVLRVQHDPCRERRKYLDGVVYRSRHAHST